MAKRWQKVADFGSCIKVIGGCGADMSAAGDSSPMWAEFDESRSDAKGLWLCNPCYMRLHGNAMAESIEPDVNDWLESQPTREEWLQRRLYDIVRPLVEATGHVMPPTRVGCGWSGSGFESCTLGVCYDKVGSKAGYYEMFVSPMLDNPVDVVCVMLHEICHAIAGCDDGHGKKFGFVATSLDLSLHGADGKGEWPTQAYPSPNLQAILHAHALSWEPYPHAALNPPPPGTAGTGSGTSTGTEESKQKQGTRLLRACCAACGYTIRITMKWASRGLPACPCGGGNITLDGCKDA